MVRIPNSSERETSGSGRGPSARELESVAALRVALRRFLAATDESTAALGLTPRQYDLLALLHSPAHPQLTPSEIAAELSLSRSATTELLTRACQAGLVRRDQDASNARRKHVTPTATGTRKYLSAVIQLRDERAHLLRLLRNAARLAADLAT